MKNHSVLNRLGILMVVLGLLCTFLAPAQQAEAAGSVYTDSTTIAMIYDQSDCYSMQGFGVYGNYLYSIKANTSTNANACIARTHRQTGETVYLTNSATGTKYFNYLGHANDLDIANVGGVATMFVTTCVAGTHSLVRLSISGTTVTKAGYYNVTAGGTQVSYGGVAILHVDSEYVTLLFKTGSNFCVGKVGVNQTSGTIEVTKKFNINLADIDFGGVSKDLSGWVSQGFEYHDNKLYVPVTGNHQTSTIATSAVIVYNMEGASGYIKNDPTYSFWFESADYPGLFEIESLAICPYDGKLYFSTNSRLSSSQTNYDAVHVVDTFVYQPDYRPGKVGNYRWEVIDDVLTPVTTDGNSYNGLIMHAGSISNGTMSGGVYCLSEPLILTHDRRWIVEWKSSGVGSNNMLLSTESSSNNQEHPYLFCTTNNAVISLGYLNSDKTQNHNYGIALADYGIDGTEEHVYRLYNKLLDGGGNMVYLSVDGVELGALNNHYIGLTNQNETSDWVSGKDFRFSYVGTYEYRVSNCNLSYIQVWCNGGLRHQNDEPDIYRWETQNNAFTAVSAAGLTVNTPTVLHGSCTDGVFSGSQFQLNRDVVLTHDRPWVVEWQSEGSFTGGAMLLAAHERSAAFNAPFLFRYSGSSLLAFGYFTGSQHNNYGVNLADLGIDATAAHVYRLTNKINADGTNMVYLSVDGVELSPMNRYFVGITAQNTTSDWISGKDFTFTYMGTWQNKINDGSIGYFQIWENGIPADHVSASYRWEPVNDTLTSITTDGFVPNNITHIFGSISGNTIKNSNFQMEKAVVLRHDKLWSISWHSEGFTGSSTSADMILASSNYHNEVNSTYVLRTRDGNFLAIGTREDAHHNYGLKLSDYGIDTTVAHSYTLCNRIAENGSNMVYLLVDGKEVGALNEHYIGLSYQNETSDWLSGKDLTFSFMGTYNYLIQKDTVSYIQINEDCVHSYESVVTPPACTRNGYTTHTCTLCGDSYIDSYVTTTGHDYVPVVTAPTCTADGFTTYTCSKCGDSYIRDQVASTGHRFVDGICTACGADDLDYVPLGAITLKSVSLSMEDEIHYNVYYEIANMTVGEGDMGLLVWDSEPVDATINGGGTVIEGATYVPASGLYGISSMGIPAKNMGDMKYMVVYAKQSDGSYVYSRVLSYSAQTYCLSRVEKTTNENMRALCVALMNYGAAAQEYFGYKTDALMNVGFEAYQDTVKPYDASLLNARAAVDEAKTGTLGTTANGFTKRGATMSADGSFALNYYFTTSVAVDKVTIYYWTAEQYASVDVLTLQNASDSKEMVPTGTTNQFWANYTGIAAKEMDTSIFACGVYEVDGVTYSTGVFSYSLAQYCISKAASDSDIQPLAAAMAVYGYHAKTYFAG